ncbi:MAG TPA: lyase family protein [Usitatibacter sp.]|jgi:3-carboxy-cis,cis-muconate cycloisomerase|nr:lyase family protein [Usitatibacter sp.]
MAASLPGRTLERPSFAAAFAAPAFTRAMLAFEAALARAQGAEDLIPLTAAQVIAVTCRGTLIDEEELVREGKLSATLAVPFVKMLKASVAKVDADAARHVHFGATSQDVLDTAMALCLARCLEEADRSLEAVIRSLARRAGEHRATPMLGRTLMQPAIPITAGLKIARWAHALAHDRERLGDAAENGLALQLGGPVGALEAMGAKGPAVRHHMALELGLAPVVSWQSHRNAWIDLMDRIAQVVLSAGKIARDVSLCGQPEVGEMLEAPPREGVGASSAMPHKRNPVGCAHGLAAAITAPGLLAAIHAGGIAEHERALGGWQAELALVPQLAGTLGTALDFLETIGESLVVNAARMRENVERFGEKGLDARGCDAATAELLEALAPYLA